MDLNSIIFSILLLIFGYLFSKYSLIIFKKSKTSLFLDNQFRKPQAFHQKSTFRLGGLLLFVQIILIFIYLYFFKDIIYMEYISFCFLFFLLGLMDDIKISLSQTMRLIFMILFLITLVILNEFYISNTGFTFLNNLLKFSKIFSIAFICLCFLFIINGSNLIDGFNGLLGIHALIIFIILFVINFFEANNLMYILFFIILSTLIFLKFNFPKADMFLGDSGSYLVGTFVAVSSIYTSILNPLISPFFFCIVLVYLFFEAFFSFLRKYFIEKRHPLHPDKKHLHMLLYKSFFKKNKNKLSSNYKVSVSINLFYLFLITPALFFMNNGLFCKYYFLFLMCLYFYFYIKLYKKVM